MKRPPPVLAQIDRATPPVLAQIDRATPPVMARLDRATRSVIAREPAPVAPPQDQRTVTSRAANSHTRRGMLSLGLAGVLSGCGWRPVYMPAANGIAASAELSAIEVKPVYERAGQLLRENLVARLASDTGADRKYDLSVNFWIAGEGIGVLSFTQVTRIRLVGSANWTLTSRGTKPVSLVSGSDRILDGFDIHDTQYFAADMENEHVQRRIAEQMAEKITLRLAMWFDQHPGLAQDKKPG